MSPLADNTNIRPVGLRHRPLFAGQLDTAAADLGIQLTWLSDFWVAQLSKDAVVKYVIGNMFPLNNAAGALLANDKVAATTVLGACDLPAVPHRLLRFSSMPPTEWTPTVLDSVALPLVVKPNKESAGIDVCRVATPEELQDKLTLLAQRYWAVALSPFIDIVEEYRVVILRRDVKMIYRKVRDAATRVDSTTEWRHNLHLGAYPEILENGAEYQRLSHLATKAMDAMDLNFAAVDIVRTGDHLQILEVNSSAALERFSQHSPLHADLALDIYRDALRATFDSPER